MKLLRSSRLLSVAVCFSLWPGVAASAQAQPKHIMGNASEAEIRALLHKWEAAFSARDLDGVMAIYAPGVVTYDVTPPLQYEGKDAYRTDFAEYFANYTGPLSVESRDVHVMASGNLGVVMELQHVSGTLTNGQKTSVWLRVTSVFRKINGNWLDVHDHVSVPVDMHTGQGQIDLVP